MTAADDDAIAPAPLEHLARPLEWFTAEHRRHREFCRRLTDAARTVTFDGPALAALAGFIRHDLTLHVLEEEEDLFPFLRRRARPEDAIDEALDRLSAEHRADEVSAQVVLAHLDACLEARTAPGAGAGARQALVDFASRELRHLALENAVVLPIARLRLSPGDLRKLSRKLAARRGVRLDAVGA
ncbi:MAG: hemerythrin domain-containing protein [Phenylobacterium sp.]|uniref:hemerythrin domain-containing protein n=1 Tax=Phenylobacterium sp. TaxID=1871053 RepID=UPI001A52B2B3|nr:hemerythrin domain-containing protein [Phenylobacterium sp.]MBL8556209.1 hemerythrin domain-containing protein [Phenylobacterium sp.]